MAERENRYKQRNHRPNPGQNRLYNSLGVKDLREILDKKRSERATINEGAAPPPDPTFNYLKDPLRENVDEPRTDAKKLNDRNRPTNSARHRNYSKVQRQNQEPKNQDIENPCNIKIEFSTTTGEHTYILDERNKLPTIKHVPDIQYFAKPHRNEWRGRGRGRGNSSRQYQTRTIKNQNQKKRDTFQDAPIFEKPPNIDIECEENWSDNETVENSNLEYQVENILQEQENAKLAKLLENVNLNEPDNVEKNDISTDVDDNQLRENVESKEINTETDKKQNNKNVLNIEE